MEELIKNLSDFLFEDLNSTINNMIYLGRVSLFMSQKMITKIYNAFTNANKHILYPLEEN